MPPKGRTQNNYAQCTSLVAFLKKTDMANCYKEILVYISVSNDTFQYALSIHGATIKNDTRCMLD